MPGRAVRIVLAGVLVGCGATAATHGKTEPSAAAVPPAAATVPPAAAVPPVIVTPASELATLDLAPRVGRYAAIDAAWVPGQPLAVNRDFDFATALGLEGIGPGIAAAKRKTENAAFVQQLAGDEPIDAESLLRAICARRPAGCPKLARSELRVYGLLFGERAARLRVIVERVDAQPPEGAYSAVSEARAAPEYAAPRALGALFASRLREIVDILETELGPSLGTGSCAAGDGLRIAGELMARDARRVVLVTSEAVPMVLSCPPDAFTAQVPAPDAAEPQATSTATP